MVLEGTYALDDFVQELSVKKKLSLHWRVRSITMGNRLDSTFALEPDLQNWDDVSLLQLRRDANVIAAGHSRKPTQETVESGPYCSLDVRDLPALQATVTQYQAIGRRIY